MHPLAGEDALRMVTNAMRQTIITLLTASSLVLALGCGGQKKPEPAKEAPAKAEAKETPRAEKPPPPKPPVGADEEEEELPDDPGEDNKAKDPEEDDDAEGDATGGVE